MAALVLLGIWLGALGRGLISAEAPTAGPAGPTPVNTGDLETRAKLEQLTRRMERMEGEAAAAQTKQAKQSPAQESPREQLAPSPREMDPVIARAASMGRHREMEDAHHREAVDPVWASAMTERLSLIASKVLPDAGASNVRVDCRTTRCLVDLEFEDYARAIKRSEDFIHAEPPPGCTRAFLLPEPSDPTLPYRSRIVVECGK